MPLPLHAGLSSSTDSSLLRRAEGRQPNAWAQLVDVYGPLVYTWCRRSHLQPADAADVMQEVFAAVDQGLNRFDRRGAGSFRSWLRGITGHKICDFLRRAQRQPQKTGGTSAQALLSQAPAPDDLTLDDPPNVTARAALVDAALEQLRGEVQEQTWQAFWHTTMAEQSAAEVGAFLGMKPGAVYQAKSRTLARLREIVRDLEAKL